jgi:hypothetical protein
MNKQTNDETKEEMLERFSLKETKVLLYLYYLLSIIYSLWFIFIVYFLMIFGVAYYRVEYKQVSSVLYIYATIIHFFTFLISQKYIFDRREAQNIQNDLQKIKEAIAVKINQKKK